MAVREDSQMCFSCKASFGRLGGGGGGEEFDPETCGMSRICHILEDTPIDTEIQVFVFDQRQISKRRMFGNLEF